MAHTFDSFTRQELIDLCREKKVSGHSKKKIHELIELLVNAGIQVPSKTAQSQSQSVQAEPRATAPTAAVAAPTVIKQTATRHYIFNTDWTQVLQYLESESVALVIAEPPRDCLNNLWIRDSLRILSAPTGILVIRGNHVSIPDVPTVNKSTLVIGRDTFHILSKSPFVSPNPVPKKPSDFYASLTAVSDPTSVIMLPFAGDGTTCRIVKEHNRSLIAMDADETSVATLYSIVGNR